MPIDAVSFPRHHATRPPGAIGSLSDTRPAITAGAPLGQVVHQCRDNIASRYTTAGTSGFMRARHIGILRPDISGRRAPCHILPADEAADDAAHARRSASRRHHSSSSKHFISGSTAALIEARRFSSIPRRFDIYGTAIFTRGSRFSGASHFRRRHLTVFITLQQAYKHTAMPPRLCHEPPPPTYPHLYYHARPRFSAFV